MSASVVRSTPCWCNSWVAAAISRSRFPGRRSTVEVTWPDVESVISLARIQVLLWRVSTSGDRSIWRAVSGHETGASGLGRRFCVGHDRRRRVSCVADAKGEHGRGGHQDAADEQGPVVAGIRGHEMRYMSRKQVVGAADRNGGEDGEAECAADLLGRVQQPCRQARLVGWDAGVGGGGDRDEHRLTKKTHRQPGPCESTPPRKTPAAAAIPLMAPQTPSAVLRSLPSRKLVVSSESAAGAMSAAPMPCASLAATRSPALFASPAASDATAKTARPVSNRRRRPSRSPR